MSVAFVAKNQEDPDAPEINPKNWPLTLIPSMKIFGVTKIPLAYVVREDTAVPAAVQVNGYTTNIDELIARSPIEGTGATQWNQTYLTDRARVWELMSAITRNKECWTYVKPAQKTHDG
mmetsp:Transcript_2969/g.4277  ORF Transcript_2969/g.4277 Transcript_2969/m.4277 type:complete len:119 (+) Transcript_2969:105-461(+)